jgi:hypothetical protein
MKMDENHLYRFLFFVLFEIRIKVGNLDTKTKPSIIKTKKGTYLVQTNSSVQPCKLLI